MALPSTVSAYTPHAAYAPYHATLTHAVRRWERRRRAALTWRWLPRALAIGLGAAVIVGLIARVRPLVFAGELAAFALVAVGVALVVSAAIIWLRGRADLTRAALRFDLLFDLGERVSTALALFDGRIQTTDDFASRQIADAARVATSIDPRGRLPFVAQRRDWGIAAALLVMVALLIALPNPQNDALTRDAAAQTAIDDAAETMRAITQEIAADPNLDAAERESLLQALDTALNALERSSISPEEAFAAASAVESELRERANAANAAAQAQRAALANAAAALREQRGTGADGGTGESGGLSEQVGDMAERMGAAGSAGMTPEQQASAAEGLQGAAQAMQPIDPAAAQALGQAAQAMAQAAQAAQQAGQSPQGSQSAQSAAQAAQQALQNAQNAAQNAEQSAQAAQQAGDQLSQQADAASDAARDVGEQAGDSQQNDSQSGQQQSGQQQSGQQQSGQQQSGQSQSGQSQSGQSQSGQSQSGQSQSGQQGESGQSGGESQSGQQGSQSGQAGEGGQQGGGASMAGQGGANDERDGSQLAAEAGSGSGSSSDDLLSSSRSSSAQGAGDSAGDSGQDGTTQRAGGSSNPIQAGNNPDGAGERGFDPVYAPRRIGGQPGGASIQLETNPEGIPMTQGEFSQNPTGESVVPYNQVFSDYDAAARQALESGYVPLGLRDVVRDYFTSLEPRQNTNGE
jgi:hypothetical protein